MLSDEEKKELEKQQYRIVGSHSAVKVCGWTKKMIKGEGGCYKFKFYGIRSNQCLQMSTSLSCANRCIFCWRGHKAPVSKEWKWDVDDPSLILDGSIKAHHDLLAGLKGYAGVDMEAYNESNDVRHVAISLTGEPIIYPKINEFIEECNNKKISTFLVTNAQYPEQIRDLGPVTQLYISLDAPNKELLNEVDVPLFSDYWERLEKSLDFFKDKKCRTCIRLTVIKGLNDNDLDNYAKLIIKGDPDFIEVKSYMFIGASRQRLKIENMPFHEDVVDFSKKLNELLPEYDIVSEHIASRVVMLAKKKYFIEGKWKTWIDFNKYNELVLGGKEFSSEDYLLETPRVGLSGKTTQDYASYRDNKAEEVEFWEEELKNF
ncbi:4-demethylwyosine synthase TYW1 [Nanoarchaeota archaeon]